MLDYGKVRDVSHLGKNRDRLPIQGDSEVKMRGNQLLASGCCVMMRRSQGQEPIAGGIRHVVSIFGLLARPFWILDSLSGGA